MAPSAEDYKLRQLILDEWRAKTTKAQALKNIQDKLGKNAITSAKVNYWYKRFDKGDTSIFNKNTAMRRSIQGSSIECISKDLANLVLVSVDKKNLGSFLTHDGRFVIFPNHKAHTKYYVVFYDLFHGVSKTIPSPFGYNRVAGMIGDFLLVWESGNKFGISKIDYGNLILGTLKQITLDLDFRVYHIKPLLDELNSNRFLIEGHKEFVIGQIEDDEIVLNDIKEIPDQQRQLIGGRLMGNELQGFTKQQRDYSSMKFCEVNLESMEIKQQTNAPIVLDDKTGTFLYVGDYCWSNSRCYAIAQYEKDEDRVLLFDPESCVWTDIQITARNTTGMFVNSDDVLTLQVSFENGQSTFYRCANKKPDSLKNLAWLAILRSSNLVGRDIYHQISHRLPDNCDLRCLISEENVEESQIDKSS